MWSRSDGRTPPRRDTVNGLTEPNNRCAFCTVHDRLTWTNRIKLGSKTAAIWLHFLFMKTPKTRLETVAFYGIDERKTTPKNAGESISFPGIDERPDHAMSRLLEGFLEYSRYEINFSPQTIIKYKDSLRSFIRDIGDKDVEKLDVQDFVRLKKIMMERGASEARISSVVYAMRSFLSYCGDFLKITTLNPKQIRPPKRFRREVVFLTKEEIERFIGTINTEHGTVPLPRPG